MSLTFFIEDNILSIYSNGLLLKRLTSRAHVKKKPSALESLFEKNAPSNSDTQSAVLPYWEWYCANEKNINFFQIIGDLPVQDFPSGLSIIDYYSGSIDFEYPVYIDILKKDQHVVVDCAIEFKYKEWKNSFKITEFDEMYQSKFKENEIEIRFYEEEDGFIYSTSLSIDSGSIMKKLEAFILIAKELYLEIDSQHAEENFGNTLTKIFKFPKEYQSVCTQYLMWFGELLTNIGIEADIKVDNKNTLTLLTVSPKDEALLTTEIEKALYLYLSLPYSEYLPLKSLDDDIENKLQFQALQEQVNFFKQQIDLKNCIIELKRLENSVIGKELEESKNKILLLESLKNSKVELLGGSIAINEYNIGPISINPANLLKLIKKDKK